MSDVSEAAADRRRSRRQFLVDSAVLAGTSLASSLAISARAYAAGGDSLKIGLIGCGGRGAGAVVSALTVNPAARLTVGDPTEAQAERPVVEISSRLADLSGATAAVSAPATPEPVVSDIDFGLVDSFRQAQSSVGVALQQFTEKLGSFMTKALEEATSLEIVTYASESLDGVRYEAGQFVGAQRKAWTRISVDGDIDVCVPVREGEVDTALWSIHSQMVQQAQATRSELLKTLVSAATNLMTIWKP